MATISIRITQPDSGRPSELRRLKVLGPLMLEELLHGGWFALMARAR
jgi:hypothetical protein